MVDMEQVEEILLREIYAKARMVDRFMSADATDAASHAQYEQDGLEWALFVLKTELKDV